jgi:hypothetical protein
MRVLRQGAATTGEVGIEDAGAVEGADADDDAEGDVDETEDVSRPGVKHRAQRVATFRAADTFWQDVATVLQDGENGPAFSLGSLHDLVGRADVVCASPLGDEASFLVPCRDVLVQYLPSGDGLYFSPGNCVLLHDGRFAQIVIPVVSGGQRSPRRKVSFVVNVLEPPSRLATCHPEAVALRWFARAPDTPVVLTLLPAGDIECRVHIVPLHGRAGIDSVDGRDYFFHLPGLWCRRTVVPRLAVFRKCPFCTEAALASHRAPRRAPKSNAITPAAVKHSDFDAALSYNTGPIRCAGRRRRVERPNAALSSSLPQRCCSPTTTSHRRKPASHPCSASAPLVRASSPRSTRRRYVSPTSAGTRAAERGRFGEA